MLALNGSLRSTSVDKASLRFRASNSAYLSRTFVNPTNSTVFTWSGWVKRGLLGGAYRLFGASTTTYLTFNSSDQLNLTLNAISAATTTAVFRDSSSWYHVVYAQNGSAQTIYVNGISVATGTTANTVFNTAIAHQIAAANTSNYFDGYLTEIYFIDGQALNPSSFGKINSTTGVWQPIQYSGTYGINGFYLKFSDVSAATATAIGKDSSGNGNNWTPNGISVTPGDTYDSTVDIPSNNFCTIDSSASTGVTLSNAKSNVVFSTTTTAGYQAVGNYAFSTGKYYWEFKLLSINVDGIGVGVALSSINPALTTNFINGTAWLFYTYNGNIYNTSAVAYNVGIAINDVIGVACDMVNKTITFYKNGTSMGQAFSGITGEVLPCFLYDLTGRASSFSVNFGQRPFTYSIPAGFTSLSARNIVTPAIVNGASVMAATAYTGTGGFASISNAKNNVSFQPNFLWIKKRNGATNHVLYWGGTESITIGLASNTSDAYTNEPTPIGFNQNGFTIGIDPAPKINELNAQYIAWQWKGSGGTVVQNYSGTIQSFNYSNQDSGFSIVGFFGTGANATVGHGLLSAPKLIIAKNYTEIKNWAVYHESILETNYLVLNLTNQSSASSTFWNNTKPTSSVFSIGSATEVNPNGLQMIAYCFSEITGFSRFGSYTGNGSADGPFVYCGFKPRFIMVKVSSTTGDWAMIDTTRSPFNVAGITSSANTAAAEAALLSIDILSNGFKIRSATLNNTSAATYIFAAWAENSIKYALAN